MSNLSFDRLLKSSRLAIPAALQSDDVSADRSVRVTRPDRERLEGKVKERRPRAAGGSGSASLTSALSKRLKTKPPRLKKVTGAMFGASAADFDQRQRAVVKIHYFNHAGGGAASLKAHGKYIAREAASLEAPLAPDVGSAAPEQEAEQARAHAIYLERQGKSAFYDPSEDSVDGGARLEDWAKSDLRHFRLILSAEEGARLRDLPSYTREVMARAGAALGTQLRWIAVDHHDTDNPHSHIVVRGRRANGQDLVIPKDFIKHGFRTIARDVATERLGQRSREDERLALDRETRRHAPTRLDKLLEGRADASGRLRIAEIAAPNGDAHLSQAMKQRLRELERMGLAQDKGRGLFQLEPTWRDRLQAMELHANVRKRVVRQRVEQNRDHQRDLLRRITKGGLER